MKGLIAALLVLIAGAAPAVAVAAPLEAYGRLPAIEDVAISPDGRKLALILTDGDKRNVLVRVIDGGQNLGLLRAGEKKLRAIQWAGSDHLLITVSSTSGILDVITPRGEYYGVRSWNPSTGQQRGLLDFGKVSGLNIALGLPEVRTIGGRSYAFITGVHFVDNRGRAGLFKVDVAHGTSELTVPGQPSTNDFIVGADGSAIAQTARDRVRGSWSLSVKEGGRWREVRSESAAIEAPVLMGLGRRSDTLLVGELNGGVRVLREYSLADGSWSEPLFSDEAQGVIHDPLTRTMAGLYRLQGDEDVFTFFDPQPERIWKAVAAAYPGQRVRPVSMSDNRRRLVVHVDSPTEGPGYAFVDMDTGRASWIGNEYQALKPADVAEVRMLRFKAADGLELSGYLTLPRGKGDKGLPLVVLPHGGPASRDRPGFDWWAQAIASRGYAVLQVNYRGSEGFGRAFLEKGFGEWGRKMQTDLSDGVRHLASQGVIDPARVCIVGGSYGGYAALAGATLDRGVYRCAASIAGVSHLPEMVRESSRFGDRVSARYWTRFMGAEDPKDPILAAISPATQAGKVDIPILLVHGTDDTVVPIRQSRLMEEALRKAGKPVELVVLKGDDHWLSRGETRLQMLQAVAAFLQKHNPPS